VFTTESGIDDCLTMSRMFCPAIGIPEDPVSGNAHGLLGAYLLHHGLLQAEGDRARFSGAQGHYQQRPGRVDVELEFANGALAGVWIIGSATMVFETTIALP
jgi:PhzF family phenazine biosynthesis protein